MADYLLLVVDVFGCWLLVLCDVIWCYMMLYDVIGCRFVGCRLGLLLLFLLFLLGSHHQQQPDCASPELRTLALAVPHVTFRHPNGSGPLAVGRKCTLGSTGLRQPSAPETSPACSGFDCRRPHDNLWRICWTNYFCLLVTPCLLSSMFDCNVRSCGNLCHHCAILCLNLCLPNLAMPPLRSVLRCVATDTMLGCTKHPTISKAGCKQCKEGVHPNLATPTFMETSPSQLQQTPQHTQPISTRFWAVKVVAWPTCFPTI